MCVGKGAGGQVRNGRYAIITERNRSSARWKRTSETLTDFHDCCCGSSNMLTYPRIALFDRQSSVHRTSIRAFGVGRVSRLSVETLSPSSIACRYARADLRIRGLQSSTREINRSASTRHRSDDRLSFRARTDKSSDSSQPWATTIQATTTTR